MIRYADVIVDLQAGDTGKGKVAHALANNYNLILRYNGGSNAGHTVYHNGKKVVTHLVPIGVLFGIPSVIGFGCVVNLKKLEEEIKDLNNAGFNTDGLIFVDERCHLVLDKHIEEDSSDSKIGTTRQGIGPTYRDKYNRTGMRMKDLGIQPSPLFHVVDIYNLLYNERHNWSILCEGAQGFQIDIDWGDYPYVTSSHCTIGSAVLNGIPPQKIQKVIGTMKAYETYSGFKTHFTNENDPIFQKIQEVGGEFGATTGRKRKVRWLDLNGVIKAININGVTDLIINKADVLAEVDVFRYVYDGELRGCLTLKQFTIEINNLINEHTEVKNIVWSMTPNGI